MIRLRVAGITASDVPGAFSIVEVNPPPLKLTNDFVMMEIRPDDFIPELARSFEGLDLLDQLADVAGETRVLAEEADDRGRAAITEVAKVRVDTDKAIADLTTTVETQFDDYDLSVQQRFTAVTYVTGQVIGAYSVSIDAGGYVSGFQLVGANGPGGGQSEIKYNVDNFLIGAPGAGFGAEALFGISTRNGVARVTMRGDFIADGSINANQINALNLTALTAKVTGTLAAGKIASANSKMLIDLDNNRITISD